MGAQLYPQGHPRRIYAHRGPVCDKRGGVQTVENERSLSYCSFFFSSRRRHTRSDRDWSSDVCSSDLHTSELQSSRRRHTRSDRDWSSDVCSSDLTSELQSRSDLVCRLLLVTGVQTCALDRKSVV